MLNLLRKAYRLILQRRPYYLFFGKNKEANYTRINDKFWLPNFKSWPAGRVSTFKNAVYFDNSDKESVYQVTKWFESGFFSKERVLVIFLQYTKTRNFTFKVLERCNINFVAITNFNEIDFSQFSIIFYPFNTITNPYLMFARKATHVFIAHGESDKLASVNPMIRMYDYVLVAGNIAKQRLKNYGIFHPAELEHRVKAVGVIGVCKGEGRVKKSGCFYAPTWEGADARQRYSSLESSAICQYFPSISTIFSSVTIRPHPSTGVRDRRYFKFLLNTLDAAEKHFESVSIQLPETSRLRTMLERRTLQSRVKLKFCDTLSVDGYELVVSDVSSVISECIALKVPNLCFVKDETHKLLPTLSASYVQGTYEAIDVGLLKSYMDKYPEKILELRKELYSCDAPFSDNDSPKEKFDSLVGLISR
ncbi:hypothetical protein [uncultured Microbulbifer sp.]|uniref:hypothetical protein n=1 Tax=uncultured Microbulbifer sp. TaxID=348147 RepID=UPI002621B43F|nr:hypothetical protein [uncultured Microbulbifer sp.]